MMRIRLAVPDAAVRPAVLNAALEAVTRTNEHLLDMGKVPTASKAIAAGVRWRPEPPGDEHFDMASTVLARGHGDCDDLAPWHAASLRHTGEDPEARAIVVPSGKNRWHAVVERGDGTIDDPSASAGMYRYKPPLQPRMRGPKHKAQIATKQVHGVGWCARCDIPWRGSNHAISGHGIARTSEQAVSQAIEGAVTCGDASGAVEPEHALKLAAIQALLRGVPPEVVAHELRKEGGGAVVGSLFGSLLKTASSFVPIPGASLAADALTSVLDKGGKGGGGHAPAGPAVGPVPGQPQVVQPGGGGWRGGGSQVHYRSAPGPIIVRF